MKQRNVLIRLNNINIFILIWNSKSKLFLKRYRMIENGL